MPEIMTVMLIAAMVMTLVASLCRPVMSSTGAVQAQTDLVQSADDALYRIQRDVRESDPNGVFVCSGSAAAIACTPASDLTAPIDAQYLAILTAVDTSSGLMSWDSTGRPAWTGFDVYWLSPEAGETNQLEYAFAPAQIQPGVNPSILNADVIDAVTLATRGAAETLAHSIARIQTMVSLSKDHVAIRIFSQATEGASTNVTSLESDAYARN